jgi:hypothetical protein
MRDDKTGRPKNGLRRTLIAIAFSSITDLLDEVSNDLGSFRWGALEGRGKAACTNRAFSGFGRCASAVPKRSTGIFGLVSASAKILITASSISWAGSHQPWGRSVPASVIKAPET